MIFCNLLSSLYLFSSKWSKNRPDLFRKSYFKENSRHKKASNLITQIQYFFSLQKSHDFELTFFIQTRFHAFFKFLNYLIKILNFLHIFGLCDLYLNQNEIKKMEKSYKGTKEILRSNKLIIKGPISLLPKKLVLWISRPKKLRLVFQMLNWLRDSVLRV